MKTKISDFTASLGKFFNDYLILQRNASRNTVLAYRDAFVSFLTFLKDIKGYDINSFYMKEFTSSLVREFLNWLESSKGNSVSTRNHRLAAIHSFVRFCQINHPEAMTELNRILLIPRKKKPKTTISYLAVESIKLILQQPDLNKPRGRRDAVLLSTLYETGARVQEIINLKIRNLQLQGENPYLLLLGKGNKYRRIPVSATLKNNLDGYIVENKLDKHINAESPLFFNSRREPLSRVGIAYIINKYATMARKSDSSIPEHINCHIFRHSRAVHLLNAGNSLIVIRDFLGHVDVKTTQIYAQVEMEAKIKAVESVNIVPESTNAMLPDWRTMPDVMKMLNSL